MVGALLLGLLGNVFAAKKAQKVTLLTSQAKYRDVYKTIAAKIKADENITIEFQVVPDDQYYNLLKVKLATKEVPDIFMHNAPQQYTVVNAARNCVDLSKEPWVGRLVNPKLLKAADGKIYAMPQESSSAFMVCYYNKKVFADLGLSEPATYAEFLDLLEKIKNSGKGITPIYMSNKDTWTTQIFMTAGFPVAMAGKDPKVWDKLIANKLKFADVPEFNQVLSSYNDLYKKGLVNPDHLSATYDMAKEAVATGKAAMMYNGEWAATDIYDKYHTELGSFVVPIGDKQIMATGSFVQGFFIPKASKNAALAKKVLNLWSQPKYMNLYYAEKPGFPGFKDVDGGKVLPCVANLVNKYISTGKYVYEMNSYVEIAGPILPELWSYYVEMVAGGKTPKQVLQAWDAKFADFMKSKQQPGW